MQLNHIVLSSPPSELFKLEHLCPLVLGEMQINTFLPKLLAQSINVSQMYCSPFILQPLPIWSHQKRSFQQRESIKLALCFPQNHIHFGLRFQHVSGIKKKMKGIKRDVLHRCYRAERRAKYLMVLSTESRCLQESWDLRF